MSWQTKYYSAKLTYPRQMTMQKIIQFLKRNLVAPECDQSLTVECVRFLYGNIAFLTINSAIIAAITVFIFRNNIDKFYLLAWTVLVMTVLASRMVLLFVYNHIKPKDSEARRWGNYFTVSAVVSGWTWALAILLFFDPGDFWQKTYIAMITLGMASGAMFMTSSWLPAYHHFILPPITMVFVELISSATEESISLALIAMFYFFGLMRNGRHHFQYFVQAVRLRNENLELVNQLREQKHRAEDANRSKTQFLASASHDLRQPVHALALFADALKNEVQTAKGRSLMGNLTRSVESIDELLSSLLDISKLDAGAVKPNKANIALQPILQKIDNDFHRAAESKNLKFRVKDTELAVYSDAILLTNVIRNLVSNALRYTPNGGILIGCRRIGEGVSIEIWDTGFGIPKNEQDNIFAEFYQLHNPERDRGKGLGLGLAICNRICQLLNHRLTLQSRHGRGSVFKIRVPLSRVAVTPSAEQQPSKTQTKLDQPVVLVVDDEKNIRSAMQSVLETWNCRVFTAGCGDEAIRLIREHPNELPELIICDFRLRDGEVGTEVIAELQALMDNKIPAIIMTGDTGPESLQNVQSSGYTLVHKPVKPMELHRMMLQLLGK